MPFRHQKNRSEPPCTLAGNGAPTVPGGRRLKLVPVRQLHANMACFRRLSSNDCHRRDAGKSENYGASQNHASSTRHGRSLTTHTFITRQHMGKCGSDTEQHRRTCVEKEPAERPSACISNTILARLLRVPTNPSQK